MNVGGWRKSFCTTLPFFFFLTSKNFGKSFFPLPQRPTTKTFMLQCELGFFFCLPISRLVFFFFLVKTIWQKATRSIPNPKWRMKWTEEEKSSLLPPLPSCEKNKWSFLPPLPSPPLRVNPAGVSPGLLGFIGQLIPTSFVEGEREREREREHFLYNDRRAKPVVQGVTASQPNQQRTLSKLPTEIRRRNFCY